MIRETSNAYFHYPKNPIYVNNFFLLDALLLSVLPLFSALLPLFSLKHHLYDADCFYVKGIS